MGTERTRWRDAPEARTMQPATMGLAATLGNKLQDQSLALVVAPRRQVLPCLGVKEMSATWNSLSHRPCCLLVKTCSPFHSPTNGAIARDGHRRVPDVPVAQWPSFASASIPTTESEQAPRTVSSRSPSSEPRHDHRCFL